MIWERKYNEHVDERFKINEVHCHLVPFNVFPEHGINFSVITFVFKQQRKVLGSQVLTEKENSRVQSPLPSSSSDGQGRENICGGVSIALLKPPLFRVVYRVLRSTRWNYQLLCPLRFPIVWPCAVCIWKLSENLNKVYGPKSTVRGYYLCPLFVSNVENKLHCALGTTGEYTRKYIRHS